MSLEKRLVLCAYRFASGERVTSGGSYIKK